MNIKFEKYWSSLDEDKIHDMNNREASIKAWNACKKAVLKELKNYKGEYVCDVIDIIKNV